uniref:Uncharacterized protein n=1 Tax=Kalanchoe fedtschenkoi TaxID=63787 RepID=A0A7N0T3K5_KALFE
MEFTFLLYETVYCNINLLGIGLVIRLLLYVENLIIGLGLTKPLLLFVENSIDLNDSFVVILGVSLF